MSAPPIGVLLLQLGTPDAPTPAALRRYLAEFLRDRRVIDLSPAIWWPILYGIVLRTRPARSARLYQKVWTAAGSPLLATTLEQAAGLRTRLNGPGSIPPGERARGDGPPVRVAVAMRYGNPSIASAVDALIAEGCDRLLAFPMYPQYAGATTGSSLEALYAHLASLRVVPPIRVVPPYFDDPLYIHALGAVARDALGDWQPDHVVVSFHGLPKRYATAGDPYPQQCEATSRALTVSMGWREDAVSLTFQSRFGPEEWLTPYTDKTLEALALRKLPRVAAICPGFTADCLETIEEMGMTNGELYERAGGGEYRLLPCVNAHPVWLDAMADIARRELAGWMGSYLDCRQAGTTP
jgi:protoporphyrin/coproporphyrin ferrochelatase